MAAKQIAGWLAIVALAVIGAFHTGRSFANEVEGSSLPGCAETAVYSLLRLSGTETALSRVSLAFRSRDAQFDPTRVSIHELRAVASEFGTRTNAVRWDPARLEQLPTPCILYFHPKRWAVNPSTSSGHFLTAARLEGDRLIAFDWSPISADPELSLPIEVVRAAWDGDAIVLESHMSSLTWQTVLFGIALLAGGGTLLVRRRAHRTTAVLMLCGALLTCGCKGSSTPLPATGSTLIVAQTTKALGVIGGDRAVEVRFPFKVWDHGPITIREVSKSCNCTTVNADVVGHSLEAGSSHEIVLQLRPDGTAARAEARTLTLLTDPPSPTPIVLAVTYRPRGAPRLSVSELVVEATPGNTVTTQFEITHHRAPSDLRSNLKLASCHWGDFHVEGNDSRTEDFDVRGDATQKLLIDTTTIRLRSTKAFDYGVHRSVLTLAFEHGSPTTLPVIVRVTHPFHPVMQRVFCGRLRSAAPWSVAIPYRRGSPAFAISKVECDPATISAELTDKTLTVAGRAPAEPGRFEGRVTVTFEHDSLPPVVIPFSGIVAEN